MTESRAPGRLPQNRLKRMLKEGKAVFSANTSILEPELVEIAGKAGLDFVWIDAEHSNFNWDRAEACVRAAELYDITPIIRPTPLKGHQPYMIQRALDIGFQGIVVAGAESREEMVQVMNNIKYPPEGTRGIGHCRGLFPLQEEAERAPDILREVNEQIFVLVLVETLKAVGNIDEILTLDGVDAVSLGHRDFCLDAGLPSFSLDEPVLKQALDTVFEAARRHGRDWTGIATNEAQIRERFDSGARMFYLASMPSVWQSRCEAVVDMARSVGLK